MIHRDTLCDNDWCRIIALFFAFTLSVEGYVNFLFTRGR
jgi:hypothetical protein